MPNTNVYFKGNDKNKSKFQDILDQISGIQNEEFDLLQELVDKETPMKPNRNNCYCGGCDFNRLIKGNDNYCSECGQKIDWSDEE